MADPLQFSDLYGDNGLGFLVQDTNSGSVADRKRAINDAYIELCAGIKAWWRKRTHDYTSSSSPSIAAAAQKLDTPTDFESTFRMYYREAGGFVDVPVIPDAEWLIRSATRSSDAGDPAFSRVIHSGSAIQMELSTPVSSSWMNRVGTLSLEYWIEVTRLSADTDEPLVPGNHRHWLVKYAGLLYARAQSDNALVAELTPEAERGRAAILKFDMTRTGRPRQLRPKGGYGPSTLSSATKDYRRDG